MGAWRAGAGIWTKDGVKGAVVTVAKGWYSGEFGYINHRALVIHSDMNQVGTLVTSNPLINQLISNIRWWQKGNFLDVPTDCPQRDERLGWTGDLNAFARTATFNYNVALFLRKGLYDVSNDQRTDGGIPRIIPDIFNDKWDGTQAMWSSAGVMIPWTLYNVYGDIRFITEQYESIHKYVDKMLSLRNGNGLIDKGKEYGDWLSLDGGWTRETIKGTQTACTLALRFNIVPDAIRTRVIELLDNALQRFDNKLATGFIGTTFLCFALSDNGLHHYAYGSVGEFLWRRVVGIDSLEAGYKKIKIAPRIIKGLDRVYGEYESVYSTITSGYEVSNDKIKITVKIPANTTAEIILPKKEGCLTVGSGEYVYEYTI